MCTMCVCLVCFVLAETEMHTQLIAVFGINDTAAINFHNDTTYVSHVSPFVKTKSSSSSTTIRQSESDEEKRKKSIDQCEPACKRTHNTIVTFSRFACVCVYAYDFLFSRQMNVRTCYVYANSFICIGAAATFFFFNDRLNPLHTFTSFSLRPSSLWLFSFFSFSFCVCHRSPYCRITLSSFRI